MVWLIISILVTLGLFVFFGMDTKEVEVTKRNYNGEYTEMETQTYWHINKKQLCSLLGLLICVFGLYTNVPANHVGIVYSPFGGTKTETLSEGFNGKSIVDKVYKMSTETQTATVKDLTTQTKDAQFLNSTLNIKYKVNSSNAYMVFKQYKTLKKMSKDLIIPTTQRVLELVTTNYNIIDILGEKRSDVYAELDTKLAEEFAKYGVEFVSISITDMDAGEALEKAIQNEAVAKKEVETAEQNLLKAEMDAKQKSVQAKAEQEAAKIEAETKVIKAEAEKKANELMKQSLSELLLKQQWIEKWDGKMPTYYGGDANLMIGAGE